MDYSKIIGARLREERIRLDMSQADFACLAETHGIAGKAQKQISAYESGLQSPSVNLLAVLSTVGVDVNYVLTGFRNLKYSEEMVREGLHILDNTAIPAHLKTADFAFENIEFYRKDFKPLKDDGTPFVLGVDTAEVQPPKRRGRPPKA